MASLQRQPGVTSRYSREEHVGVGVKNDGEEQLHRAREGRGLCRQRKPGGHSPEPRTARCDRGT